MCNCARSSNLKGGDGGGVDGAWDCILKHMAVTDM